MPSWSHSWQDSSLCRSRVGFNLFIADSSGLGLMLVILNLSFILDWTTNPLSLSIWERLLCTASHTCPLFNLFSLSTSSLYCSLKCTQTLTYMGLRLWCSLGTAILTLKVQMVLLLQLIPNNHTVGSNLDNFLISTTFIFYASLWKLPASPVVFRKVDHVDGGANPVLWAHLKLLYSLLTVYLFVLHWPAHPISKFVGVWYVLCMPGTGSWIALSSLIAAHKVPFLLWVTTYY